MTDREPYDATFDLGGLPGGDVLFSDPTATAYAEPSPTAAVPPAGGTVYRPDPPPVAPAPPAPAQRSAPRPRPSAPSASHGPAAPTGGGRATPPRRPRPTARRRPKGWRAWPLVAVLIWGVPAAVHVVRGSDLGSGSRSSSSEPTPVDVTPVHVGDMTYPRPHSVDANSVGLTIHIDAPTTGSYTVTEGGTPLESDVTAAYDLDLGSTMMADSLFVASSEASATIRCEIRDARGEVVATGEATGTLDCVYDPDILLE